MLPVSITTKITFGDLRESRGPDSMGSLAARALGDGPGFPLASGAIFRVTVTVWRHRRGDSPKAADTPGLLRRSISCSGAGNRYQ